MTTEYDFSFSRHVLSEVSKLTPPSKAEGAGKTGCALHPRSHVQCASQESAHEHTGSAEAVRPSLRNGFTAYIVLSLVTGLSCHHHRRDAKHHRQLERQRRGVRTTRLRRTQLRRSSTRKARDDAAASTATRPNVSDDGQRPLLRDRMAVLRR